MTSWADFEQVAPELARLGRERFERTRVALMGTIRADGTPRISPIEPYLFSGQLVLVVMRRSVKAADLERDPRCALHSSVSDVNGSEGEFQVHGRALSVDDDRTLRDGAEEAWWVSFPRTACHVYAVDVEAVSFVGWEPGFGVMRVLRWTPRAGPEREAPHLPLNRSRVADQ